MMFDAHNCRNNYKLGIPTNILDNNKKPECPDWPEMISSGSHLLWEVPQMQEAEYFKIFRNSLSKEKFIFKN